MEHHNALKGKAFLFLFFLWYLWFINFTVRAIFAPILPLIEDEFAISHAKASSIFIFQSIGFAVSVLLSGFYSGRFGYKKTILSSLLIASVAFFLVPFVKIFLVFYVFAFVLGFATGLYLPAAISLITEYFTEKNWGKSIAVHDSAAPIAIFGTPLIALFLLHFFKWRGIYEVFAIVFLASAIVFYCISDEVKVGHSGTKVPFGDLIRKRSLWIIGTVVIFTAGANMGIYQITPLYLTKELLLSIDYANTILSISRFGGIGVAILCGFLADKISLRKIMFIMVLVTGILTVLIGIVPVRFVVIVFLLQALFVTGIFPLSFVLIARTFSRETRGMATSLVLTVATIFGSGVMSYLLGLSGDLISFRFGISVLGVFVILSSLLLLRELK
jgi:NNP family nitrate/nitrite transporter-like MFS transporter